MSEKAALTHEAVKAWLAARFGPGVVEKWLHGRLYEVMPPFSLQPKTTTITIVKRRAKP